MPKSDDHKKIRPKRCELMIERIAFNGDRLHYRISQRLGFLLDRRRHRLPPPSLCPIGLSDHLEHMKVMIMKGLKSGDRKLRCSHKNNIEHGRYLFFSCFFTFRANNCFLSMLM